MESGTRNGSEELLPAHVKCNAMPNKTRATATAASTEKATSRTKQQNNN